MRPSGTMTLGVVAPLWLHEPLGVMLQAAPGVTWTGCATTADALLSAPVEEPPDLVLLHASDRHVASQLKKVKAAWPGARCIVLVEHARLQEIAQQAGADLVLLEGLVPGRLIKTLDSFLKSVARDPSGDEALRREGSV